MLRAEIPDLYTPIFDEVTMATFNEQEDTKDLEKLFDVQSDDSKQVDTSSVSGLGIWVNVSEGQGIPQEDVVQLYNETFEHDMQGKGFSVSEEALDDDEYAILKKVDNARALGSGAAIKAETDRGTLFDNAFTAGATAGADGVALCSSSHPQNPEQSSTLFDNAITDAFDHDGLETMELQIANNLLTPKGTKIPVPKAGFLVHGWALRGAVRRVLSDRAIERPDTANRDINIYARGKEGAIDLMPLTSRYLSSTTAWFIVFPSLRGLRWYWRKKPQYTSYLDHANRKYVFEGQMRYSLGWTGDGWRSVWGSTGAG